MAGKPKKRYIFVSEVGVAPKNNKPAMNAAASPAALPRSSQTTPSSKSHKKKKKAETPEKSTPSLTQTESGNAEQTQLSPSPSPSSKRKNLSPGVRLVNGRIYDSDKGKTCHQCRQKTLDFAVSCENRSENKQCTFHFCHICLLNRYGEEAEEMAALGGWKCPRCRGICNCSFCMKKRGCCPTGRLVLVAKASGFTSVSEMLLIKNSEEAGEDASPASEKEVVPKEEGRVALTRESIQENGFEDKSYLKSKHKTCGGVDEEYGNPQKEKLRKNDDSEGETKKITKEGGASPKMLTSKKQEPAVASTRGRKRRNYSDERKSYLKLPRGIELSNVAQIDLPAEDIGHALQFLEFCAAFAKVLDIEEGQSEYLLQELACGRGSLRSMDSSIVQFHVKLLSMIQKDTGKEYSSLKTQSRMPWLQALYRCICESQFRSRELLLDCLNLAAEGDGELNSSKKLRLLNFLCDEALGTEELRSWIDEQNLEFLAEREKVRNMKMKLHGELATDMLMKNGVPHSVSEHRNLVLKIKAEAAQTFVETLEAKDTVTKSMFCRLLILIMNSWHKASDGPPKRGWMRVDSAPGYEKETVEVLRLQTSGEHTGGIRRSDAVRSEAMFLDGNGRKFWKLRGYSGNREILIQDIGNGDSLTLKDRWFSCNFDERETIENYYLRYGYHSGA
ncbi:hypothetical protein RHMOL_Rhmol12G0168500 [Rhododendron molle]|uniref:Uncharacterized protein n=1 Tax=Rhododendron molle TaxID=49168 RepID=A0ACC0LJJ2_RHOML|nr:hypothetical protein RHMOL_Rhmol12G0168500 [Rhododendron molle]